MSAASESIPMRIVASDGVPLFVRWWLPKGARRGVVQIAHGLAEHSGRYAWLAETLAESGWAVYAHDQRGHGRTARDAGDFGHLADDDGWRKCIDDLGAVRSYIAEAHPGLPIILLGHSMGSFMAQQFVVQHGDDLAGLVLAGSDAAPPKRAALVSWLGRLERLRIGRRGRSALLDALVFGRLNRRFEPARTPFDWLSRDEAEVDAYMADPLCRVRPTVQLWIDFISGRRAIGSRRGRLQWRLPVLVISGSRDPVGRYGVGTERLAQEYRAAGVDDVTNRTYPDARHELFHETNRDDVARDLVEWLDGVIRRRKPKRQYVTSFLADGPPFEVLRWTSASAPAG